MLNTYKPTFTESSEIKIRSLSSRRARLFAGGTYFRSIDSGKKANNISVQLVKEDNDYFLIVTNYNLQYNENVLGPTGLTTKILDMSGSKWNDLIRIDQLDTLTPRTQYYSIRCSIAFSRQNGLPNTLPQPLSTGTFTLEKLFSMSGKISVKIEKNTANFTSNSVISIAPRFKIYKLLKLNVPAAPHPVTSEVVGPFDGIDLADMRSQVNASKTWIEMLERAGAPGSVKNDEQDEGVDAPVGSEFSETYLVGGDGLPENPTMERTGPSRSIVLINYEEKQNGSLGELNQMYVWVGKDAVTGDWQHY